MVRDGFFAPGDGGAARYVASASACPLNSGAGDDGSQVATHDNKCWLAMFDSPPDVRVWGARDIGLGAVSGTDSSAALVAALRWCGAGGGVLTLSAGRFAAVRSDLVVPHNCTLRFAPHAGWSKAGHGGYAATISTTDSAILLGPARKISVAGVLEAPAIFPYGLEPATSFLDAQRKVAGFTGTAVEVSAPDAKVLSPFIVGFNLCVLDNGFERPWIIDAQLDCTNGISFINLQDVAHVANVHGYAYFLNDIDGTPNANGFAHVSGAADDGSGLIRLTVDDAKPFADGMEVKVRDVRGLAGANGTWRIRIVDRAHIDLLRSAARGVTAQGSWRVGETAVKVAALDNIWFGQRVSGSGIQPDTVVRSIDFFDETVWLSKPTVAVGSTLTFTNEGFQGGGLVVVDNLYRSGTFINVEGSLETHFTDTFEYGWRIGYRLKDSTWTIFTDASCDTLVDPAFLCMWWDGTTTLSEWNGGEAGGVAAALLDTTTSPSATNSAVGINVRANVGEDPSYAAIMLHGVGTRQLDGLFSPNGGVVSSILQYAGAGLTTISGAMPFLDLFPQNQSAEAQIRFGRNTVFASESPYVFNPFASWTPMLTFGGTAAGLRYQSYGKADIAYPWLEAKFNISLTSLGTSKGVAIIGGLPATCEGSLGSSGEGGATAFASGMRELTSAITAMPQGRSGGISLWQNGPAGATPVSETNFTGQSLLNGQIRCRIAYRQR